MRAEPGYQVHVPPVGVLMRVERPADVGAISDVHRIAFPDQDVPRLVELLRGSPEWVPDLSLVAEIDGRVVGHVAISMAILRDLQRDTAIANLSPLGVLPSVQRRGIGSALVDEVVARAAERGEPLVVVEGDPAFYGRLGFEYSVPLGIRITLPSWARRECAQVRVLRGTGSSLRGLVVYPPAFDEVD